MSLLPYPGKYPATVTEHMLFGIKVLLCPPYSFKKEKVLVDGSLTSVCVLENVDLYMKHPRKWSSKKN